MTRDEFFKPTKAALAKRAGFLCSYPGCKAVTVGPSDEDSTATSSTGEAAHICAASGGPGARRYVAVLSPEYRSSIDNGIWCCKTHARLIDTDEVTYTIGMLKQWRLLAERRAELRQAYGDIDFTYHSNLVAVGLAPDSLSFAPGPDLSARIGAAVQYSCLAEICGTDVADAVRDFLIEHTRNAFSHGNATTTKIEVSTRAIEITDDGGAFTVSSLAGPNSRGGGLAYRALLEEKHLGHASSRRVGTLNHLHIPFVLNADDLPLVNPCAVALDHIDVRAGTVDVARFTGCDRVFLIAPDFASYSDGPMYENALRQVIAAHPGAVLIFPHASRRVLENYKPIFPTATVESW